MNRGKFQKRLIAEASDVTHVASAQGDERWASNVGRDKLHGTIADDIVRSATVEGVELRIVGAIHEAVSDDGRSARAARVVLLTIGAGPVNAETTIDVGPSPAIGRDIRSESDASPRIGYLLTADVHRWSTSTFADDQGIGKTIADRR